MRRRQFITLVGGSAAAWSFTAHAQQPAMPVIGFLAPVAASEHQLRGFHQGLKQAGFVEGENVSILYRSAENEIDRLPALADDLVRRKVAVIAAAGNTPAFAAKTATAMIPILFIAGEDPVRLGLVTSLARPAGNLTGVNVFATELVAKRLALLRDLVPTVARLAVLVDPASKDHFRANVARSRVSSARHGPENPGSQCQQRPGDRCGLCCFRGRAA
jgi:putative tryptophan/tyrosine transport system substrate-binding protein